MSPAQERTVRELKGEGLVDADGAERWTVTPRGEQAVEQNRCAATDTLPHVKALRTTADDLEHAFPGLADDQRFADAASKLRRTLDGALTSPPMNCEGVAALDKEIGGDCKACHQDFR